MKRYTQCVYRLVPRLHIFFYHQPNTEETVGEANVSTACTEGEAKLETKVKVLSSYLFKQHLDYIDAKKKQLLILVR